MTAQEEKDIAVKEPTRKACDKSGMKGRKINSRERCLCFIVKHLVVPPSASLRGSRM